MTSARALRRVPLTEEEVGAVCEREISTWHVRGKRILLVTPDHTRSAPMGMMFRTLHRLLAGEAAAFDVLIALGTHPPLDDEAIERRFGLSRQERLQTYGKTRFHNHAWKDPGQLVPIGEISADEVARISGGLLREPVPVTINKRALDYDLLLLVGPTFPHEVAGFSGGNKYLFPGISGPELIDMFHWLGALVTNVAIIGRPMTPVRAIIDLAASMVPVERKCVSLVVLGDALVGVYAGSPEEAWREAATMSEQIHVRWEDRSYASVLSCAPSMYEELWVGGKCAYKLEPVVTDGGELTIYAPHISRVSATHGQTIRQIGYHVRDYFVKQPSRFSSVPRGVMAHSTHVKGLGTFADGVEHPRIQITLATGIPESECRALNLGYRDPRTIDPDEWRGREGRLLVPRAGEILYRLRAEGNGDTGPPGVSR